MKFLQLHDQELAGEGDSGLMELASQSRSHVASRLRKIVADKKPAGTNAAKVLIAPPTFSKQAFEFVTENRADFRSGAERMKDAEYMVRRAEADEKMMRDAYNLREQRIRDHIDARFKAHSNMHTLWGANTGVFTHMPTSSTYGRRGSLVARAPTPARRLVPQRLAALEDEHMKARRRAMFRGALGHTYHQQLHGQELGVGGMPLNHDVAFMEMGEQTNDGVVHDVPPPHMRELPPL